MLDRVLGKIDTAEEEFLALTILTLPVALTGFLIGIGYCAIFPTQECFQIQPFIYGILSVIMLLFFYHMGSHIEHLLSCISSSRSGKKHLCILHAVRLAKFDLKNWIRENIIPGENPMDDEPPTTEDFQGFK